MLTLEELVRLRERALEAAREGGPGSALASAYVRLYEVADTLHALMVREVIPEEMLQLLQGTQEAPAAPEGAQAPPEPEAPPEVPQGPQDKERSALDRPVFLVRPKTAKPRFCSECGEEQWRSSGGWTCKNGHGGAPSVDEVE